MSKKIRALKHTGTAVVMGGMLSVSHSPMAVERVLELEEMIVSPQKTGAVTAGNPNCNFSTLLGRYRS